MARRKKRGGSRRFSAGGVRGVARPALTGAAGALFVNGLVNYLPLPDTLKSGNMLLITKAGLAIALAMFGRRIPVIGTYSQDMARGALTVTLADLGKDLALSSGLNLSGTGYVGPGLVVNHPRRLMGAGGAGMYVRGAAGARGAGMYVRR